MDTFSFQAPAFYKKHDYREVFTLEEYPYTGRRHYYTAKMADELSQSFGQKIHEKIALMQICGSSYKTHNPTDRLLRAGLQKM